MKYKKRPLEKRNILRLKELLALFLMLISTSALGHAQDPRVPADDHPLAKAVGRIIYEDDSRRCTGWIAEGGVLITAEHCKKHIDNDVGDAVKVEFNVYESQCNGIPVPSDPEDIYEIDQFIASGDDWAIFKVLDNTITGLQPIEAQLVHIELVQDLTGSTFRTLGYGVDAKDPDGGCGGSTYNKYNKTLQTDSGDNLTSGTQDSTILYDNFTPNGTSGGPVIDEDSLYAVGVHHTRISNGNGDSGKGTSAYKTSFWNAYQNQLSSFNLKVYQENDAGSDLSGTTVGRWNNTSDTFVDGSSGATKLNITVTQGNLEILRGDQGVYNSPKEKFNRWENNEDVRNHKVFQMDSDVPTIISQFKKTQSTITVKNYYPEYSAFTAGGQVEFKDPWLIDYVDPDFDNETRNRGKNAEFVTQNSPFTPGFSAINGKLYNGLFLNENENFLPNLNNYSVRQDNSPTTESFGGSLGNREVVFHEWTGVNANFEDPDEEETGVVFTSSSAEARANFKVSQLSNNSGAFKANQRKVLRTSDGSEHMVYESLGRIWYEVKESGQSWEFLEGSQGTLPLDAGSGVSPSIDHNEYLSSGSDMMVVAWQEGSNIQLRLVDKNFTPSYEIFSSTNFSHGQSSSYEVQPTVAWTNGTHFAVLWRSSQGIKYRFFEYSSSSSPSMVDINTMGTISGTSGAKDFAVDVYSAGTSHAFDVAYEFDISSGTQIRYTYILFSSVAENVTQATSTLNVVSSGSRPYNRTPSIVSLDNETIVGWVSSTSSSWSPSLTKAAVASVTFTVPYYATISRNYLFSYVHSTALGKLSDGSEYYVAFNNIFYNNPGYPAAYFDKNYLAEGSNLSTVKTLNTRGYDLQIPEADSENELHVYSYYQDQVPYNWKRSNAAGSYFKQAPLKATMRRGIALTDSSNNEWTFSIGDVIIDGLPVAFISKDSKKPEEGASEASINRSVVKNQPLSKAISVLKSEPFPLNRDLTFTFADQVQFSDSLAILGWLDKGRQLTVRAKLVDELSGEILATLRELRIDKTNGIVSEDKNWKVNPNQEIDGVRVQLVVEVETDIEGLQAVVEDYYSGDYALGKINPLEVGEELTLTPVEKVTTYGLSQNYPNPFNPTTQIEYQIPNAGLVQLEVFDILGRKVQTLVNETQEVGTYTVTFDASSLSSGVYLYRLSSGSFIASKKLFLIK